MQETDLNFENAAELAHWIAEGPKIINPMALESARNAFVDTVACILAAANDVVTDRVFRSVRLSGGGLCSVVGRPQTLPAEAAALVNGTAAHALDFDDNFLPAVTHASAVLVPALMALGEEIGASGDQLLDAYIVGLQVHAWLGNRMIPAHYAAGWHATSTIGAVGAAAACIRLLSLDSKAALNALSIATSMAGGSKQQFGSMVKPLHAGLAARAGIAAARFADNRVEANDQPFSGQWGFFELHHACEIKLRKSPQTELAILSEGLAQKRFPCCASAHRTLDAILILMKKHKIVAVDIDKIVTVVPDSNFRNLRFADPKSGSEARFSMTYCAAVAALFGKVRLADFSHQAINRPSVRQFMNRVHMQSAGAQSDEGCGIWDYPAVTTISINNGREYSLSVQQPVGTIHAPMAASELSEKFFECAGFSFSAEKAQALFHGLAHFGEQKARHVAAQLRGLGDPRSATWQVADQINEVS